MTDIVERLRKEADFGWNTNDQLCGKAADKIEQLRQRIEDAEIALRIWDHSGSSEYWLRHPSASEVAALATGKGGAA